MFNKKKKAENVVYTDVAGQKKTGGKGAKKLFTNVLVTVLVGLAWFYLDLPAINLHDPSFYGFFFGLTVVYCICAIITNGLWRADDSRTMWKNVRHLCAAPLVIGAGILVFCFVGGIFSSVVFRANSYKKLLAVEPGSFTQDVEEISFSQIPMLDKNSAQKLGDRKLGELSDMVSQFEVASNYTQINFQDRPVRVTPLEYGDLIKWLNNRKEGLPAYVVIDMVTQSVEVVRLDVGMKYTTAEHFSRNLYRYLRFHYPTFMFDDPVFEIDEEGVPYWVCPRLKRTIGLFGGTDADGVVLVNAVTGETSYEEEAPTWVDHVYEADLIIEQYDYYGMYQNGFLNSLFGQKGVTKTTVGYNYIALNDDVYMYTGITSVGDDQSNVGFILTNQRTKDTKYYAMAGATEQSAMSSAEGVVQHLAYTSTFPLLLNIQNQPTYFMALKDNAGLVKMYAMVNVQQYQVVATGVNIAECRDAYGKLLYQNNISHEEVLTGRTREGKIAEIRAAVIEGNTVYYIRLEGDSRFYYISAADSQLAIVLNVGDTVVLEAYGDDDGEVLQALSLSRGEAGQAPAAQGGEAAAPDNTGEEAPAGSDTESTTQADANS